MPEERIDPAGLKIHPLTPARWDDFEALFGSRGACAGCWCMYWRMSRSDFHLMSGEGNHTAMRALVESGETPGLLAYADGVSSTGDCPVGWVSLGPREDYPTLQRSRILRPVDDRPVWSLVCFFVDRQHRRQGVTGALIRAALAFAAEKGAGILEAYPVDPQGKPYADVFAYTGLASSFFAAGFVEVARNSPKRPILRYFLSQAAES